MVKGPGKLDNAMVEVLLRSDATRDYLKRMLRLWLGLARNRTIEIPEMPEYLKHLFLRTEEYTNEHRDQWGTWEHPFSLNYQEGRLWTPEVDCWVSCVRNELVQKGERLEPPWPDGCDFALCLTHDVDAISDETTLVQKLREAKKQLFQAVDVGQRGLLARATNAAGPMARSVFRKSHGHPSTERTIEKILGIEKRFGVTSSFFFVAYPLRKYSQYDCLYALHDPCTFLNRNMPVSEMMREMVREGFDIGLHGSYYSATDAAMLKEQKVMIEDAVGTKIFTARQHWLNWDASATPRVQTAAGLLADSTLGFNRNVGFRAGVSLPYYSFDLLNGVTVPVLEVPLIIHDGPLTASDALEYDIGLAKDVTKRLIDRVIATRGCVTVSFHPHSFLDGLYEELYTWLVEYCLERNGWVVSLKAVCEWWRKRERVLEA
jgi:peptidoglycan/xylan/chitin deacetylase (PgdA/CDA1 family)